MILRTDSKYPINRAYVVKLSCEATADMLCGRLEHLVSGEHRGFNSAQELLLLMTADLAMTPGQGQTPDDY